MDRTSIHMEPLHKRLDLTDACVDLLNTQWPRSKAARLYSLEKSCDGLPYSLVMVECHDGDDSRGMVVIGYCRLAKVISAPSSVLIESVVVPEHLRGRGLGRRVMELAESHAKTQGYTTMYLCTKDKQDFYAHLGYKFCQAVNTLDAQMIESCDCYPEGWNSMTQNETCSSTCSSAGEVASCDQPPASAQPACECPKPAGDNTKEISPPMEVRTNDSQSAGQSGDTNLQGAVPPPPPPPPVRVPTNPVVVYWMKKEVS